MEAYSVEGIGRFYTDGTFNYPSVTTVLQVFGDTSWLDSWRERVGAEFADAYVKVSADIGTALHDDYDCWCAGRPLHTPVTDEEKQARRMFKASLPSFKRIIDKPVLQEVAVVSHKLKIAGRFDLLAIKDGKYILLDFKNTKRNKGKSDIEAYKMQLAFYHRMLAETYPEYEIAEHVVFMVNRDGFSKVFRYSPSEVTDIELMKIRGRFYRKFGS